MVTAGIACVKNEQDIIEPFVRHNLQFLDSLIVMDGSLDGTPDILAHLAEEFPNLTVLKDEGVGDRQSERMTKMLRLCTIADYIVTLDADEFLYGDLKSALPFIPTGGYGLIPWRTYLSAEESADPPRDLTSRRDHENPQIYHAVVRVAGHNLNDLVVFTGNHEIGNCQGREMLSVYLPGVWLLHFPFRSREQYLAKVICTWPSFLAANPESRTLGLAYGKRIEFDLVANGEIPDVVGRSLVYESNSGPRAVSDPVLFDYCRKYSTGKPMPALQLIALTWEKSITGGS